MSENLYLVTYQNRTYDWCESEEDVKDAIDGKNVNEIYEMRICEDIKERIVNELIEEGGEAI